MFLLVSIIGPITNMLIPANINANPTPYNVIRNPPNIIPAGIIE